MILRTPPGPFWRSRIGAVWLSAIGALCTHPLWAAPELCDVAAQAAARDTGVPLDLLLTLTRVETGRGGPQSLPEPWPWTLNMGGDGSYHESAAAAVAAAQHAIAEGRRNIDIGCFQINFRWHGDSFPSIEAMIDPRANALYAARFLRDLHAEFGNWTEAAQVFHSRNPAHGDRYLDRFHEVRAALAPQRGMSIETEGYLAGPSPLVMATRPALSMMGAALPLRTTAARPLWETR
jgi:hypothetical protein